MHGISKSQKLQHTKLCDAEDNNTNNKIKTFVYDDIYDIPKQNDRFTIKMIFIFRNTNK